MIKKSIKYETHIIKMYLTSNDCHSLFRDNYKITTPPREKACSQKRGNVAHVRSSRQGAKKL